MKASIVSTVVGAVILFLFGLVPQAKSDCSSILNSTYGWQGEAMYDANGNPGHPQIGDFIPLVFTGYLTFDGNGNFSGAHDSSFGGSLIPHVDSGTYSVNSDCTTGTVSFATGSGFIMSFVITAGGQEIKFVSALAGDVNFGTLRPMAAIPCSASTVSGNSYSYSSHGLVAAGKGNGFPREGGFVPFTDAGRILFADGSVSGTDNQNFGGVVLPGQTIAGTYTVNSDCTGTTTMTIAGVDSSWHFVILQGADQIIFIATPSGDVWAGALTKE